MTQESLQVIDKQDCLQAREGHTVEARGCKTFLTARLRGSSGEIMVGFCSRIVDPAHLSLQLKA